MTKPKDTAAHERATKVRDWISAQRDLPYTAKEAAAAIFGEGYTKAEQHYVSSVLSKHSMAADGPVVLVGGARAGLVAYTAVAGAVWCRAHETGSV
jgi:hypothetical protein